MRALLLAAALLPGAGPRARDRPNEADLFGSSDARGGDGRRGGDCATRRSRSVRWHQPSRTTADGGIDRDRSPALAGAAGVEVRHRRGRVGPAEDRRHAADVRAGLLPGDPALPRTARSRRRCILDLYLDGRPNDRLRAYAVGRLQFDPTRPAGDGEQHHHEHRHAGRHGRAGGPDAGHPGEPVGVPRPALAALRHRAQGVRHAGAAEGALGRLRASGTPPTSSTRSRATRSTRSTFAWASTCSRCTCRSSRWAGTSTPTACSTR